MTTCAHGLPLESRCEMCVQEALAREGAAMLAKRHRKPSKYKNRVTIVDGIKFKSGDEARRYSALKLLQEAGQISELRRQVPFVLAPSVKFAGEKRAKAALRYFADFTYIEDGRFIVEDSKGMRTPVYQIKRHLMLSVHGIDIRETGGKGRR